MTWQDDQRVLCDALLERGYRVEMRARWCVWRADVGAAWTGSHCSVWAVGGYATRIGTASTIPEVVALVVEHLDLDGRPKVDAMREHLARQAEANSPRAQIRRRLLDLWWVESADVQPAQPGTVAVTVYPDPPDREALAGLARVLHDHLPAGCATTGPYSALYIDPAGMPDAGWEYRYNVAPTSSALLG